MKKLSLFLMVALAFATTVLADEWIPCTDSDGGHDYFTQGTTGGSHFANGGYYNSEDSDYCDGPDGYLIEYFCDGINFNPEEFRKEIVLCDLGCFEGACNQKEPEVPEFGLVAAGVAVAGAVAGFFFLRKK
jgi:hypothetical protein